MNVLIVEDETAAAEHLACLLKKIDVTINIAGYAESVEDTISVLDKDHNIDLIFMDIHLSDGSAFDVFNKIKIEVPIVFTTAFDRYALEAFKVNSIDYLLKPIGLDELRRAIEKFHRLSPPDLLSYLASLSSLKVSRSWPTRIIVPHRDKLIPVPVSDICYVYSSNRKTVIVLNDAQRLYVSKTLSELQEALDPQKFRRVNKQFIISKGGIQELVAWFDSRLVVKMSVETPEEIFVSKNSVSEFKRWVIE